ncbi:MAG: S-layer homology domain-containing protein, partial [Oscillospiraceae bacterium]|nr:S-layer homology domain-containing protein [Oscillospiraceae bacterium]
TRAQVARMLWNMAGQPPVAFSPIFTDVPATAPDWYRDAVIWAGTNGIVLGYQGRFNSHENITREQFAIMMFRYAQFTGQNTTVPGNFNLNQFTDQGAISEWALRYVRWAVYNGLITGTPDARIAPQGTADRAEAATILMRFMQRFSA